MSSADLNAIVIDNGTALIKAGIAGDDAPRAVFPTIVGRRKRPSMIVGIDQKDTYIGTNALQYRGVLHLERPIERGEIKDWENMEEIWNQTITQELLTTAEEQGMMLTVPVFNSRENKEKMTRMMFENFNVPYLYIGMQNILSLYASGKFTGIMVDIGEGFSSCVPVFEGVTVDHAISRIFYAGYDITLFLKEAFKKQGITFSSIYDLEILQHIKEKCCQVAMEYPIVLKEAAESKALEKEEVLPDGVSKIKIGLERYSAPEALFNPRIAGIESLGIHECVFKSISSCEIEMRKELSKNIMLSGGTSMFPFLPNRLQLEVEKLAPSSTLVRVLAPPERKFSSWIGGSLFASLSAFSSLYISRNEYNEFGPEIVHKKCL